MDGNITDYVDINRGVPQGTVLGALLFSLMVNDIKLIHSNNGISKYADDITFTVLVRRNSDTALAATSFPQAREKALGTRLRWQKSRILRTGQPKTGCL